MSICNYNFTRFPFFLCASRSKNGFARRSHFAKHRKKQHFDSEHGPPLTNDQKSECSWEGCQQDRASDDQGSKSENSIESDPLVSASPTMGTYTQSDHKVNEHENAVNKKSHSVMNGSGGGQGVPKGIVLPFRHPLTTPLLPSIIIMKTDTFDTQVWSGGGWPQVTTALSLQRCRHLTPWIDPKYLFL